MVQVTKRKKEKPKFVNEVRCFDVDTGIYRYNIESITELEPGTIFGAIFHLKRALCVLPRLEDTEEGYKDFAFSGYSSIVYLEMQGKAVGSIPMIFKKLDGNFVEDILTGIKFMIGDVKPFDASDTNTEHKFVEGLNSSISKHVETVGSKKALKDFREAPIVFDSYLFAEVGQHDLSNVALVVNDEFKAYYGMKVLSRKDDVIKGLQEMYEYTKFKYEAELNSCLTQLQDIATTEDFLYAKGCEFTKEK